MISSTLVIQCEGKGCQKTFKSEVRPFVHGQIMRRDTESARREAHPNGWRRLCPDGSDHYGDYCPDCVERMALARARIRGNTARARHSLR